MAKNIQLLFTDEEMDFLDKEASKQGVTVSQFIKSKVLENDVFGKHYQDLLDRVNKLPAGVKFNIRSLFGTDWTMPKGVKLTLGKTYYNRVLDKTIANVRPEGKDSSNVIWYIKL